MELLVDYLNSKIKVLEKKGDETPLNLQNINNRCPEENKDYSCELCDFKAQKSKILKAHMKEKT